MRRRRGFTLLEMMITVVLVALVYTMMSTILVQVARYVRVGREVAEDRHKLLTEVETIRYQLRTLYYPDSAVGLLGERTPQAGRDWMRFLTTKGRQHRGVVEVGYKVDKYRDGEGNDDRVGLFYREFPFGRTEMRTLDEYNEAPWKLVLPDVETFSVEYSATGQLWQREWDGTVSPRRIRLRIIRRPNAGKQGVPRPAGDKFIFTVTPGVGAGRW